MGLLGRALREGFRANMMIGPRSALWNAERAAAAEAMERAGRSPEAIWRAVRTVRGADRKWRQEAMATPGEAYPSALGPWHIPTRGGGARVGPFIAAGNDDDIAHELAHWVQGIERRSPGANSATGFLSRMLNRSKHGSGYERSAGEVEARMMARRRGLSEAESFENPPLWRSPAGPDVAPSDQIDARRLQAFLRLQALAGAGAGGYSLWETLRQ